MNAPILSSLKINLPTEAGKLETFVLSEPRTYPEQGEGRLQPRRLLGRARGGRRARRQ